MSRADIECCIRALFTNDHLRPELACTVCGRGELITRCFDRGSSEVCLNVWEGMWWECTKYYGAQKKVMVVNLTGILTNADFERCPQLV